MYRRFLRAGLILGLFILGMPAVAYAQYTSPNYKVDEIFIGGGSVQDSCSTNFCSNQSAGDTAVGDTSSVNFKAQAGSQSTADATIEVSINNNIIDLGVLNTSSTAAASASFSIKSYLTDGYVVRIYGDPPTNVSGDSSHALSPLASPNPSTPGTEQFGINLVANSTPGIGANPSQAPDDTFSFGAAEPGYSTPDQFKYVDGDAIASSAISSGETDYTISIIANISQITPGGRYKGLLTLQVIATF
jgi:hypothetical protein